MVLPIVITVIRTILLLMCLVIKLGIRSEAKKKKKKNQSKCPAPKRKFLRPSMQLVHKITKYLIYY